MDIPSLTTATEGRSETFVWCVIHLKRVYFFVSNQGYTPKTEHRGLRRRPHRSRGKNKSKHFWLVQLELWQTTWRLLIRLLWWNRELGLLFSFFLCWRLKKEPNMVMEAPPNFAVWTFCLRGTANQKKFSLKESQISLCHTEDDWGVAPRPSIHRGL